MTRKGRLDHVAPVLPNELMNLRAADAASVADAADNVASKSRRPGPQLMARALSRHDVACWSCLFAEGRGAKVERPPVPPGEPTGLNKERPGQSTEARRIERGADREESALLEAANPGDGKVVGTVNTCEPVIKIVMLNEPKRLSFGNGLRPKWQRGLERGLNAAASWTTDPPVDSRYLPPHMLRTRNVETPYISCWCQGLRQPWSCEPEGPKSGSAARWIDRCARLRCRKKPTPRCNGADTGPGGRSRKRAHVRRVFRCERVQGTIVRRECK